MNNKTYELQIIFKFRNGARKKLIQRVSTVRFSYYDHIHLLISSILKEG